jgi:GxxExxY protein
MGVHTKANAEMNCKTTRQVQDTWKLVVSKLGSGQSEAVYQRALASKLSQSGLFVRTEVPCPIFFDDECVGAGRADIVLPGIVIELKLHRGIHTGAKRQAWGYAHSLSQIERRAFKAMVLSCDPETGDIASCVLTGYESTQNTQARQTTTTVMNSIEDDLFTAFKTKYKVALASGTWVDSDKVKAHLTSFLEKAVPGNTKRVHKQKVDNFLRKNFKFTTQSRNSTWRPRRVRVCFPKEK